MWMGGWWLYPQASWPLLSSSLIDTLTHRVAWPLQPSHLWALNLSPSGAQSIDGQLAQPLRVCQCVNYTICHPKSSSSLPIRWSWRTLDIAKEQVNGSLKLGFPCNNRGHWNSVPVSVPHKFEGVHRCMIMIILLLCFWWATQSASGSLILFGYVLLGDIGSPILAIFEANVLNIYAFRYIQYTKGGLFPISPLNITLYRGRYLVRE